MVLKEYGILVFYIIFVCITNTSSENTFSILKRNDIDLRTCVDNFVVDTNKIIRTDESKKLGAKYLNGQDLSSRLECMKLCCKTISCNVFVYEEKRSGTCYLFDCGGQANFKCKFTKHYNYSSAFLIINRPSIDLETEIKYTQNEHELEKLRNTGSSQQNNDELAKPFTKLLDSSLYNGSQLTYTTDLDVPIQTGRCSRNQFECRKTGECIAIYNTCDGIPQCSDHSDEDAVELGCPTTIPVFPKQETPQIRNESKNSNLMDKTNEYFNNRRSKNLEHISSESLLNSALDQSKINHQDVQQFPMGTNQRQSYSGIEKNYAGGGLGADIDKNGPAYFPGLYVENNNQFPPGPVGSESRIFRGNSYGPLRNFIPRGNGYPYNYPVDNNAPYNAAMNEQYDVYGGSGVIPPFSGNNNYYYQQGNNMVRNGPTNGIPSNMNNFSATTKLPNDPQMSSVHQNLISNNSQHFNTQNYSISNEQNLSKIENITDSKKFISTSTVSSTTKIIATSLVPTTQISVTSTSKILENMQEVVVTTPANKNHHVESLLMQIPAALHESALETETSVTENEKSTITITILSIGFIVTSFFAVLFGCKFRTVQKRLRRAGRGKLAHDADFLVNGMYL